MSYLLTERLQARSKKHTVLTR